MFPLEGPPRTVLTGNGLAASLETSQGLQLRIFHGDPQEPPELRPTNASRGSLAKSDHGLDALVEPGSKPDHQPPVP